MKLIDLINAIDVAIGNSGGDNQTEVVIETNSNGKRCFIAIEDVKLVTPNTLIIFVK